MSSENKNHQRGGKLRDSTPNEDFQMKRSPPNAPMGHFKLRPISELDTHQVVEDAGGKRAHPDADRRAEIGADYILGNCVIELKALDDEGLAKPERQKKLAALFGPLNQKKPVVVLDRNSLPPNEQRNFYQILEGPIKTAISKAKKQLKQSRLEHEGTTTSIIWFINNGYTALDHAALLKLIAHRVKMTPMRWMASLFRAATFTVIPSTVSFYGPSNMCQ